MQISIIKVSELDKKSKILSSEYYNKNVVNLDRFYNNSGKVNTLKDISKRISDFGSFSLYNKITYLDDDKNGIPFLRVLDISENYIDYDSAIKIDLQSHTNMPKSQVNFMDLVYSIIGTLGICSVSTRDILCNSNQSLVKITVDVQKANPFYVCAYLNSKFGRSLALRGESGGLQKHITLQRVRSIPIYLLNTNIQNEIGQIYQASVKFLEESKKLYNQAEKLLLNEIGFDGFKMKYAITYTKNSSKLIDGRLDPEFYRPEYEKIIQKIRNYKNGSDSVKNKFKQNRVFAKRTQKEYRYVEIGDILIPTNTINYRIVPSEELPYNAKIQLNYGDILISKVRPNRGAVVIVDNSAKDIIGSDAFVVLKENADIKKEILVVLLKTIFYRELLLKCSVGTEYPVIKDDDVLDLPIPIIQNKIQEEIVKRIKESSELKHKSNELLNKAIKNVEDNIHFQFKS